MFWNNVKMSKSERETSAKVAQNSWRRLWTAITLSLSNSDQCEDDEEDCQDIGEGIFETQPLAVGSKYDTLAAYISMKIINIYITTSELRLRV